MIKRQEKVNWWFFVALELAMVLAIIALVLWIAEDATAEETIACNDPGYSILLTSGLGLYNSDVLELPFELDADMVNVPALEGYEPRDTEMPLYVVDWQHREVIHLYTNRNITFAQRFATYAYGDDGNPHPVSRQWVSGWDKLEYLAPFYRLNR